MGGSPLAIAMLLWGTGTAASAPPSVIVVDDARDGGPCPRMDVTAVVHGTHTGVDRFGAERI
jgi:hypothetical protein